MTTITHLDDSFDVTIIGGGVNGLAVAHYLLEHKPGISVVLFEKEKYFGSEQSGHNSGAGHGGWVYEPGSLKAQLCVRGNSMLWDFCKKYNIAAVHGEKLVVSQTRDELEMYLERGRVNGVQGLEIISGEEIRRLEPNVVAPFAMRVPSSFVVDGAGYAAMLEKLVKKEDGMLFKSERVVGLDANEDGKSVVVRVDAKSNGMYDFKTKWVINAAGLWADEVAKLINPDFKYHVQPVRGEYMKFRKSGRVDIGMTGFNVYPVPQTAFVDALGRAQKVAGTHLTPTFSVDSSDLLGKLTLGDTVLVGPYAFAQEDRSYYGAVSSGVEKFLNDLWYFPSLRAEDIEPDQVGVQVKLKETSDFVIERDVRCGQVIHIIAGSPSLTSSLANAEYVVERLMKD